MNKKTILVIISVICFLISAGKCNAHPTSQWSTLDHYTNQNGVVCSNVNKLMYFNASCNATGPTESDIKGFNVITGILWETVHVVVEVILH